MPADGEPAPEPAPEQPAGLEADPEQHARCEKMLGEAHVCPKVRFLLDALAQMGRPMPAGYAECRPCTGDILGGFDTESAQPRVVICENSLRTLKELKETLGHELIHAYDQARALTDWSNPLHRACSEVRAANLSGDCRFGNEFKRGNWNIKAQQRACVARRAELSFAGTLPQEEAAEAVRQVFEVCYADTAPYDRNP